MDAGIEVARLARQVTRVPRARVEALRGADARAAGSLDTSSWADLPGSCFTYGAQGRALLETRAVHRGGHARSLQPARGRPARSSTAAALLRLVRTGRRLDCFHAMHDNVHGFDVHFEIDLEGGVRSRRPTR